MLKKIFFLATLSLLLISPSNQAMNAGFNAQAGAGASISWRVQNSALARFFAQSTVTKLFKGVTYTAGAAAALPASYCFLKQSGNLFKEAGQSARGYNHPRSSAFIQGITTAGVTAGALGLAFAGLWALEGSYKMAKNARHHLSTFKDDVVRFFH